MYIPLCYFVNTEHAKIMFFRDGVCKTCDEVDTNIKSMYQLMAKVEELNKSMSPAYKIGEQVKELRKLVEMYDNLI